MNRQESEHIHHQIRKLILTNQIGEGIEMLEKFVIAARLSGKLDEVAEHKAIYQNMLSYTVRGISDPQREQIFKNIQRSLIEISDFTLQFALSNMGLHIEKFRRELHLDDAHFSEETLQRLDERSFNLELGSLVNGHSNEGEEMVEPFYKEVVRDSFYLGWVSDQLAESDVELLKRIRYSKKFSWIDRCLVVSGLSLGLQRNFDKEKFIVLDHYLKSDDPMVRLRALTGLVIAYYIYDDRIKLYPELETIFENLKNTIPEEIIGHLILQLLKACDTENISKKFREEIIPEVMKLKSKFSDKLELDKLVNEGFSVEKNPDWEKIFDESPTLLNKLQEYTEMQMEGSDVLMGTFSRLKHFDFFKKEENWFLPFYKETDGDGSIIPSDESKAIVAVLDASPFMCNSDKYSMLLNLYNIPPVNRETILEMLSAERDQLNELMSEEANNDPIAQEKITITHIIQDLYRFVKLYYLHNEIPDIFQKGWDMPETHHLKALIDYANCLPDIAHFYFNRDIFDLALRAYEMLTNEQKDNPVLYEKAGYCCERINDYAGAIKYYKRAELFDTGHSWIYKRTGWCYRQLKDANSALTYFLEAEKREPENANIQSQIGNCYLDLKEYQRALEYFFRVEFMNQESHKAWRPIAWCCFILGKLEEAERYYKQIIDLNPTPYDYMNMGHLLWCTGHLNQAIPYYMESIQLFPDGLDQFILSYFEDKDLLKNHGIAVLDIDILPDILRFKLEEKL